MIDAVGDVQRILLLGGTSELGLAIVRRLLNPGRDVAVILAGRDDVGIAAAASALGTGRVHVRTLPFDAEATDTHADVVEAAWHDGDVDVVVVAFGQLGDQPALLQDPAAAARLLRVNTVGAVSVGLEVARRLRTQGHGRIVALSSIAAARARPGNFIYGASKAGFDAFFDGLGYELAPHGVTVTVLRPGFVPTRMTAGLDAPPLSSTVDRVATAARSTGRRNGGAYVSPAHRILDTALRVLPRAVVRRLP